MSEFVAHASTVTVSFGETRVVVSYSIVIPKRYHSIQIPSLYSLFSGLPDLKK